MPRASPCAQLIHAASDALCSLGALLGTTFPGSACVSPSELAADVAPEGSEASSKKCRHPALERVDAGMAPVYTDDSLSKDST